jgi:hypothetical protein
MMSTIARSDAPTAIAIAAIDQDRRRDLHLAFCEKIERRDSRVELTTSMVRKYHPMAPAAMQRLASSGHMMPCWLTARLPRGGPGLGLDWDEHAVERYAFRDGRQMRGARRN